jgi:hypothetical protein
MNGILMLQIAVFILSLCLLGSLIGIVTLYSKCEELRTEKDKLSKEKDKIKKEKDKVQRELDDTLKKDLIAIEPGHKVIYPDYGLSWTDTDKDGNKMKPESFKVTYELEVLEVTETRIKVKAVDFTSMDQIGRDASKKASIIQFMKDKWVEKHQVQLIVDDSVKRDLKLKQLGIE